MQTTAPVSATGPESTADELAVRWLYPRDLADTPLSEAQLTLGRDPGNDVVLDGTTTSRRHALLLKRGRAVAIRDLGGQNGVYCDGVRVDGYGALVPGTVLRLGGWVAVVVRLAKGRRIAFGEVASGLLGSEALNEALELARRMAPSDLNILVQGETGSGKELVARAIHSASGRSGRMVSVNCAALAESLVEAELFGHERGAFTGAGAALWG